MKKTVIASIIAATFAFSPITNASSNKLGDALESAMVDSFLTMGLSGEGAAHCAQYVMSHPKSNRTVYLIAPALSGNTKAIKLLNDSDCDGDDISSEEELATPPKVIEKTSEVQFYGADLGSGIMAYITNTKCDLPEAIASGFANGGKFISTIPIERLKTAGDYYYLIDGGKRAVTVKGCFIHTPIYNTIHTYAIRKRDGKIFDDNYNLNDPMWFPTK